MLRHVHLVDQGPHRGRVQPTARGDKARPDFDDYAHGPTVTTAVQISSKEGGLIASRPKSSKKLPSKMIAPVDFCQNVRRLTEDS